MSNFISLSSDVIHKKTWFSSFFVSSNVVFSQSDTILSCRVIDSLPDLVGNRILGEEGSTRNVQWFEIIDLSRSKYNEALQLSALTLSCHVCLAARNTRSQEIQVFHADQDASLPYDRDSNSNVSFDGFEFNIQIQLKSSYGTILALLSFVCSIIHYRVLIISRNSAIIYYVL